MPSSFTIYAGEFNRLSALYNIVLTSLGMMAARLSSRQALSQINANDRKSLICGFSFPPIIQINTKQFTFLVNKRGNEIPFPRSIYTMTIRKRTIDLETIKWHLLMRLYSSDKPIVEIDKTSIGEGQLNRKPGYPEKLKFNLYLKAARICFFRMS